jgi:hypothetical protein
MYCNLLLLHCNIRSIGGSKVPSMTVRRLLSICKTSTVDGSNGRDVRYKCERISGLVGSPIISHF